MTSEYKIHIGKAMVGKSSLREKHTIYDCKKGMLLQIRREYGVIQLHALWVFSKMV